MKGKDQETLILYRPRMWAESQYQKQMINTKQMSHVSRGSSHLPMMQESGNSHDQHFHFWWLLKRFNFFLLVVKNTFCWCPFILSLLDKYTETAPHMILSHLSTDGKHHATFARVVKTQFDCPPGYCWQHIQL